MIFTRIPENFAPLSRPARYEFRNDGPARTLDVEIVDARSGVLLSARRFYRASRVEIDVAPVLRRLLRFEPAEAAVTGFSTAEERCARIFLRVEAVESPVRTFLAAEHATQGALATVLPRERLLARDEQDELTLLAGAASVEVTARGGGRDTTRTFAAPDEPFPLLFRLRAADFAGAERLTLRVLSQQGAVLAALRYGMCASVSGGVRVAWWSRAGSLEHYTFPVRLCEAEEQHRTIFEGEEGCEAVGASGAARLTLLSAYEPGAVLRALAGIGTAPRLWIAKEGEYRPVEVLPAERVIARHGTLRAMELTLCAVKKGEAVWN